MTSDFIYNVNFTCWAPPYRREDKITIVPGETLEESSKMLMGIPDKDISKFIKLFENTGLKSSAKAANMLFGFTTSNQDALNKGSLTFLGVRTRDLLSITSPNSEVLWKFLVLPSMKIYWLNKDVVAQIVISRKLRK